jgi:hypothetical protein
MAQTQELSFIISAINKAEKVFQEVEQGISGIEKNLKKMQPAFKQMAMIGTAGFVAVSGAIALSVKETMKNEAAQNRLSHILKTATGATDEQIKSLNKQATAMEKVGVMSAESITQAQAQLATFDLQAESIERMIPSILDYVVAEKGASASTEDLKQLTNGLAQALQGNFASLTRTGFVLDDATKELIKNGTEVERTTALVSVLNSTYEGFNASARQTAEGGLKVLGNEINNLRASIGEIFIPILNELLERIIPIIEKTTEWIKENPELTKWIFIITGAVSGLVAGLGLLGLALIAIMPLFTMTGLVIGGVILTIGLISVALFLLYQNWTKIWDSIYKYLEDTWIGIKIITEETWNGIKQFFEDTWDGIKIIFDEAIEWIMKKMRPLLNAVDKVKEVGSGLLSKASSGISAIREAMPFANGGIVTRPTLGLVGEAGPEAIIPLSKAGMMGGITINITGGYYLSEMASEDIGNKIIEKLKKTMKL